MKCDVVKQGIGVNIRKREGIKKKKKRERYLDRCGIY